MTIATGQQALASDIVNVTTQRFLMTKMATKAHNTVMNANDTEKTVIASSYTKYKEIKLLEALGMSVRIKFSLQGDVIAGATIYGKIYRNGVAIGTQHSNISSYVEYTEDFDCSAWAVDDLIQIYCYRSFSGSVFVKNFRLCYELIHTSVNQDP